MRLFAVSCTVLIFSANITSANSETLPPDYNEGPEIAISDYEYTYSQTVMPNVGKKDTGAKYISAKKTWDMSGGKQILSEARPDKWYKSRIEETTWPAEKWPPSSQGVLVSTIVNKNDGSSNKDQTTVGSFVPGPAYNNFIRNDSYGRYALSANVKMEKERALISETLKVKIKLLLHGNPNKIYEVNLSPDGKRILRVNDDLSTATISMDEGEFVVAGKRWDPTRFGLFITGRGGSEIDVTPIAAGNYIYDLNIVGFKQVGEARTEIDKTTGEQYTSSGTIDTTASPAGGKPEIEALQTTIRELQEQIKTLQNKIDGVKCSRGLAPCKEKVLIPSKQLLPALPKEQQLGNILNTLQILIESLSNPKR
ncbi:MAG: hypothetical protein HYY10_03490 [Candidatus Liptonbacteria bacterium]|nr:hypothetical protein [Candidatus Liptonbacteria bacterium]